MKAQTDQITEGRNAKQTDGQTKLTAQQWTEMQTEGRAEAKEESAGLMDGKYKARRIERRDGRRERREVNSEQKKRPMGGRTDGRWDTVSRMR